MKPLPEALKVCPRCGAILSVLLFLGIHPDGYICTDCKLYYSDDLQPLAIVIGEAAETDDAR